MKLKSVKKEKPWRGNYSHGLSGTPFFSRFSGIQQRTSNPRNHKYAMYGGRGIKCLWSSFDEFARDMYDSFVAHAEENGERNTTIERIDNNGHYCKENCRWATPKEQAQNTRSVRYFTHKGITKSQREWERTLGICRGLIRYHTNKGRSFNQILKIYNYGE